jgi:hypothetical protein
VGQKVGQAVSPAELFPPPSLALDLIDVDVQVVADAERNIPLVWTLLFGKRVISVPLTVKITLSPPF